MNNKSRCPNQPRTAAFLCVSVWLLLSMVSLSMSGCSSRTAPVQWQGETMGTYYRVTLPVAKEQDTLDQQSLHAGVTQVLDTVNRQMSTYLNDSELSRFNQLALGTCQNTSEALIEVVTQALNVHSASGGSFNPLVEPLVRRWGFGTDISSQTFPSEEEITRLLLSADISKLQVDTANNQLCKSADLQLDLSAIAKGYAVDEIASWLQSQGITNYLVDIGGEIKVAGRNPQGRLWRLAIEKPEAMQQSVFSLLEVTDQAVATSGDYRNFFEHNGKRYSHTIDPVTGYPTMHNLASVTVVHASAMLADAWATALLAAGPELGKVLAAQQELAVFMIQRNNKPAADAEAADMGYSAWHSQPMQAYFAKSQTGGF